MAKIYNNDSDAIVNSKLNVAINEINKVDDLAAKVPGATGGNLAVWGAGGELADSGQIPGGGESQNVPVWSISETYDADEVVQYNGEFYASEISNNIGNEPGVSSEWRAVSDAEGVTVPQWEPGLFTVLNSRVRNLNILGETLDYVLQETNLPFESIDFDSELSSGIWKATGYAPVEVLTDGYNNPLEGVVSGIGDEGVKSIYEITDGSTFRGACADYVGNVYFAPYNAPGIGRYNIYTKVFDYLPNLEQEINAFSGIIFNGEDSLYLAAYSAAYSVKYDISTQTVTFLGISSTTQSKFDGIAYNTNGIAYFACSVLGLLLIDTATDEADYFSVTRPPNAWSGGTIAPNGDAYFAPRDATQVLRLSGTVSTYLEGDVLTGTDMFSGAVCGPDGNIYFVPNTFDSVMILNPTTKITSYISLGGLTPGHMAPVLAPNGKIYAFPTTATYILEIDPINQTVASIGKFAAGEKWAGSVLTIEGKILSVPSGDGRIMELDGTSGGLNWWGLSKYLNNF